MKSFFDEAVLALGLSPEQTTLPRVVFYYNEGVMVEGHKGLLDCKENGIIFRFSKEKIKISGNNLKIKSITPDQLFIRGKITSIGTVADE